MYTYYTKALEFFVENGIQLTRDQIISLREANTISVNKYASNNMTAGSAPKSVWNVNKQLGQQADMRASDDSHNNPNHKPDSVEANRKKMKEQEDLKNKQKWIAGIRNLAYDVVRNQQAKEKSRVAKSILAKQKLADQKMGNNNSSDSKDNGSNTTSSSDSNSSSSSSSTDNGTNTTSSDGSASTDSTNTDSSTTDDTTSTDGTTTDGSTSTDTSSTDSSSSTSTDGTTSTDSTTDNKGNKALMLMGIL